MMLPVLHAVRAGLALAAVVTLAACGGDGHDDHDDHGDEGHGEGHVHVAPHGGTLVELGDHFANAEFLLDAEAGKMEMYTLGGHASVAERSPNETVTVELDVHADKPIVVTLAAQASDLSGETVGDSSYFTATSEELKGLEHFHGKIVALNLKGTDFENVKFDFDAHEDHDGEDHDGEGHDEDHDGEDHDGEDH